VKAVGVIPEPETGEFDLDPQDKFMILASDGVWEFISSQEAVEIVNNAMPNGSHAACQTLIETAAARWQEEEGDYRDDVSTRTHTYAHTYSYNICRKHIQCMRLY
jgi:serine/threonine protein phosphatase PrpC